MKKIMIQKKYLYQHYIFLSIKLIVLIYFPYLYLLLKALNI